MRNILQLTVLYGLLSSTAAAKEQQKERQLLEQRELGRDGYCCSWDDQTCGEDQWCNESADFCSSCDGKFINPNNAILGCCSWDGGQTCGDDAWCNESADSCNIDCNGMFISNPSNMVRCCSWDGQTCGEDAWCNESADFCSNCEGEFIISNNLIGCCSWDDYGTCGSDVWCNQSAENCEEWCSGSFVFPSQQVGPQPTIPLPTPNPVPPPTPYPIPPPTPMPTPSPTPIPAVPVPTPNLVSEPTITADEGCCTWDLGNCNSNDPFCDGSAKNCEECPGSLAYIYPARQVGCTAMWTTCDSMTVCCGKAECVTDNGWTHCNLPDNVTPTGPSPTNPPPTMELPTRPAPTGPAPTNPPPPPPFVDGLIGPNNNSERITLPRPPIPIVTSVPLNCPHTESGLESWDTLFSPDFRQNINIPTNTRVLISQSIDVELGVIDIPPSSELIIGENVNGINLDVGGINVRGTLTIGSETCRIESAVTITLHGTRPGDAVTNIPAETYKGISVTGTISLHGKRYYQTWTRLAATARAGDTSLRLQENVNWENGQEIVLVTTAMKDSKEWHENEVLEVVSVTSNNLGSMVNLLSGITYDHVAIPAYQAEVGLLTRTIVIRGAETDSEPTDSSASQQCSGNDYFGNSDRPCPERDLTGFGGHIIVRDNGRGYVEGVELFRMGQTNVLGRYPIHFHELNDCPECYFRDSSIHRSYYRCISIHATNYMTASENVAYDVTGFCYYLEDGIEQHNKIHFNLAAHIHTLGPRIPTSSEQLIRPFQQTDELTLPADVTASGFYITNVRNEVIGNAASGGWAGFAFPNLRTPLGQTNRYINMRPSSVAPLDGNQLDGNTAHSSGWWWSHAGAFYFGGSLYYNGNVLEYNAGRGDDLRDPCEVDMCARGNCDFECDPESRRYVRLTNSKAFLTPGVGLNSWSGRMEILGFECHDCGLSIEALEPGFWIDNLLAQCRTGEPLRLPPGANPWSIFGNGFGWYDTNQEHIITSSTFRNCGSQYDNYDNGCNNVGCVPGSSVFTFLTHSSEFNPEVMQATRAITFENCGRRFDLFDWRRGQGVASVSGRLQNWLDEDGSVSGLGERSVIASSENNGLWWKPDGETGYDAEGPVHFFSLVTGTERGLGHMRINFDRALHSQVGVAFCTNGFPDLPCDTLGHIKHIGPMFAGDEGLPMTAQPDVVGPVGGFGWLLRLDAGAPRQLEIEEIEVGPDNPLMLHIAYPPGTTFEIEAYAPNCDCTEQFTEAQSSQAVRTSLGNSYYMSNDGLLSIRIVQFSGAYIGGDQGWILPDYSTTMPGNPNVYVLDRFERAGVRLPRMEYGPTLRINAINCGSGTYCDVLPPDLNPDPCPTGYSQVAFDMCCRGFQCICADGSSCV